MKKDRVSIDLCQGEGCICFEIKSRKPRIVEQSIQPTNGVNQIFIYPGPPPTTPPMAMLALTHAERRRALLAGLAITHAERRRALWEGRHR
jgi:hypothetical protein